MLSGSNPWLVVVAFLFAKGSLVAAIPEKYQTIIARNPFALLPPPPVQEPTTPPASVDIKITGFSNLAGVRRVYFAVPPKTPKDHYRFFNLTEGQQDGGVEVLSIQEADGAVQLRNAGVEMTLSLKKNGFSSPISAAPNAVAGGSVMPIQNQISPVYNPGSVALAAASKAPATSMNPMPAVQNNGLQNMDNRGFAAGGMVRSSSSGSVQNTTQSPAIYNSVVYNPVQAGNQNRTLPVQSTEPVVDPVRQIADMREYERKANENNGMVPIEVPSSQNSVVAQPPTRTRWIPAPPMPPLPQ